MEGSKQTASGFGFRVSGLGEVRRRNTCAKDFSCDLG